MAENEGAGSETGAGDFSTGAGFKEPSNDGSRIDDAVKDGARLETLRPLIERCNTGFFWSKGKNGPRHKKRPLTEAVLKCHFNGGPAVGASPIAPGTSTTRVALLDLDSHKGETPWDDMVDTADSIERVLDMQGMKTTAYRSSGGQGIHLFLLWEQAQDAYSVRLMLTETLEACGLKNGTAGVAQHQVEIFPKQDHVPADGFGSMF